MLILFFLFSAVKWFFSAAYMGHRNTAKSVWKNEWMYCVKSESHLGQFLPEYLSWYVKLPLPLPFVEDPMLYAFLKERLCIQNSFKFFHEIFGSITKCLSNIEVHIWDYPLFDETTWSRDFSWKAIQQSPCQKYQVHLSTCRYKWYISS